ncbi:MAG: hypothetical protein CMJ49_13585 [Planctomycetaceae bacterium]|nr:hypothetical protein [Planctomycetaceae bacterium]
MADTTDVTAAVITNPAVRVEDLPRTTTRPSGPGAPGFLSREHILDATADCFAESGYDGTTIRAIAKRLGCSVGSIYRYFDDKRALLDAMVDQCFTPAKQQLTAPDISWTESAMIYARHANQHAELYALMFWLARSDGSAAAMRTPRFVEHVLSHWVSLIGDRTDAEKRWAAVHGAIALGRADDVAVFDSPPTVQPQSVDDSADESDNDDADPTIDDDVTLL